MKGNQIMKRRLIHLTLICVTVLFIFSVFGCSSKEKKASTDLGFEQTIEEKLNKIVNPTDSKVSLSSNPYDYIKGTDSNEDYKYIVSQGEKSLNYMLSKFKNSKEDGLKEYILAIACSEILKENPSSKNWSSGRGWYNIYTKTNEKY